METPVLSMEYDDITDAVKALHPVLREVMKTLLRYSDNGMVRTGNFILLGMMIVLFTIQDEEDYKFARDLLDFLWEVKKIGESVW